MSGFNMIFGGRYQGKSRSYLPLAVPSNGNTGATVACSIAY